MFHFNAIVTAILAPPSSTAAGPPSSGGSPCPVLAEMNRTGATVTSTLGTMAYLLAHDVDPAGDAGIGRGRGQHQPAAHRGGAAAVEVDSILRSRFGVETFSGAYGVTEASSSRGSRRGAQQAQRRRGDQRRALRRPHLRRRRQRAAPGTEGEIVSGPKRPHTMFEGYWGRPEATVETSRNWWYHTGDVGRIDDEGFLFFVDRKADYLRRGARTSRASRSSAR
jgi:crotonobetaine/carnitine-CoA ligase